MGRGSHGVLGDMLAERELHAKDLHAFFLGKRCKISYATICRYVSASDRDFGKKWVWAVIDEFVRRAGVWWDGETTLTSLQEAAVLSAGGRSRKEREKIRWEGVVSLGISDYRARNRKKPRKTKSPAQGGEREEPGRAVM